MLNPLERQTRAWSLGFTKKHAMSETSPRMEETHEMEKGWPCHLSMGRSLGGMTKLSLKISDDDCAAVLRALSDSTRLRVVRLLLSRPRLVSELNGDLEIEQSLLSHHLRILRDAGLVSTRREGKSVRYQLARGLDPGRLGDSIDLGCCCLSFRKPSKALRH